jgi:hypothetical protein
MSFGFPAYSMGSLRFNLGQQDLVGVVSETLGSLGWRYESPLSNKFFARNSPNPWSWGEKIAIEVSPDGTVTARSECLLVTQCFDWGKNHRNVRAFFDQVSRVALAHEASRLPVRAYDEACLTPLERVIKEEERQRR